jgi:hypothetical protein
MDIEKITAICTRLSALQAADLQQAAFQKRHYTQGEAAELTRDVLIADWSVYTAPCDQLEPLRAQFVCHAYPQGFEVYTVTIGADELPVGYTAWLPITKDMFERMRDNPQSLTHRGQITADMPQDSHYFYLFNVSIIEPLRKTPHSKQMMQDMAARLATLNAIGISAVTVADDGIRAVTRLGMQTNGNMTHDGDSEPVYTGLAFA